MPSFNNGKRQNSTRVITRVESVVYSIKHFSWNSDRDQKPQSMDWMACKEDSLRNPPVMPPVSDWRFLTKGQFAIEYLLVTGFLFMLLIPSLYILYSYSAQLQEQVSLAQATEAGHAIIATVEKVYSYGKGSKLTLGFTMPALVEEFYYQCLGESPCELVIKIRENELSFSTDVPLFSGQAENIMGKQYFGKKDTGDRDRFVAPGQKTFVAVHVGNNVILTLS